MNEQLSTIEKVLHVIWTYTIIAGGLTFCTGFAIRWWQTHMVSLGHFIVGGLAVVSSILLLIAYALTPPFAWVFVPFAIWWTGFWVLYNDWYYYRFPHVQSWLASTENQPTPPGMNSRLGQFLLKKDIPSIKWTDGEFRVAGIISIIIFLLAYNFSERINGLAESDKRNRATLQKVGTVAKNMKEDVVDAVRESTDTLASIAEDARASAADAKVSADSAARLAKKTATLSTDAQRNIEKKLDRNLRVLDRVNSKSIQAPALIPGKRKVSDNTEPAYGDEDTYVSRLDTLNYY